ncbi:tyrosine--tRNA ligase, partial [Escherichia coli]
QVIERKIMNAYCPISIEGNPIIEIVKYIIFGRIGVKEFKIEREKKYGGDITYKNFDELKQDFLKSNLHPLDLKKSLSANLIKILQPIKKRLKEEY